jgi:hypothetical protein
VLVAEVLVGLGEPPSRVAALEEGDVVAAPQVAVAAPDDPHVHADVLVVGHRVDEPGQLPGRRVVLAADRPPGVGLRRSLGGGHAFDEEADGTGFARAVVGPARADDVVAEHALNVGAGVLHHLGHVGGAVEALLLTGHRGEDERRLERPGGEDPGELEEDGHAGGVVVGARRVAREVHDVGDA